MVKQQPGFTSSDIEILKMLCDKKIKNKLLKDQPPAVVKFIRNICWNLLHGNIAVTAADKRKLAKFKRIIRKLADTKIRSVKGEILQSGGFVSVLTPILVSLISSLGGKLVSKAVGL
jgi:hypothetical protein